MISKFKTQNAKCRNSTQNSKFSILVCGFTFLVLNFSFLCFAEEITILYTGETHSMIYPCLCPVHPDGGVARRAAIIKKIRRNDPDALLVDCGGFFGSGQLDEYAQNTQLDIQRTRINLEAMRIMRYDAVNVGDDEFNFGDNFLKESIDVTGLHFLSGNIKMDKLKPYLIKNIKGINIGIIGVSGLFAMQKAGDYKFLDPKTAVKNTVDSLKERKVDIVVVLGHLSKSDEDELLSAVPGIDVIISGHPRVKDEPAVKTVHTIVARPYWQGKKIGKLSLTIKDKKIVKYRQEAIAVTKRIKDDPETLFILPACFADGDCKKRGLIGVCQNPGMPASNCLFKQAKEIKLSIVTADKCKSCAINIPQVVEDLRKYFPRLKISYIYYPNDKQALKIVDDLGVKGLPVYLLGREIEKEEVFGGLGKIVELKGDFYMLKPQYSGLAYFLKREKVKNRLDVFLSLYNNDAAGLLALLKEYAPILHFLAGEDKNGFVAMRGRQEIEEYKRCVCIEKYYPGSFWNYITCRAKDIESSWWDDCLSGEADITKIKTCAKGKEAVDLLKQNTAINRELEINYGPAYLLNNQEVFASQGVPSRREFKKMMKE